MSVNKTEQRSFELNKQHQENYDLWISRYDTLGEDQRFKIKNELLTFVYKPLISIILSTDKLTGKWLQLTMESILCQLYENWELCITVDDSSGEYVRGVIKEFGVNDSHINYVFREASEHTPASLNRALAISSGEWITFLDHGDILAENALSETVALVNKFPETDIIYSDEDKIDEEGKRFDPYFKPDWNPELFLGNNFLNHLLLFRRSLLQKSGQFRLEMEGAEYWDLFIRLTESVNSSRIQHISKIIYHKRANNNSLTRATEQKTSISQAQRKVISSHLKRIGKQADLYESGEGFWRIKYRVLDSQPKISIIIPTKDKVELLHQCIESIHNKSTYKNFEIIIVNNQSLKESTKEYFSYLELSRKAKVLDYPLPFNYSAINNFAVNQADGEVVLLLNNDVEVISADWLEEMVSLAIQPSIGAVGAKLYYPDGRIQHAGVILGIYGIAGHAYKYHEGTFPGQMGRALLRQNLSAVTGACLMVEKKKFAQVGGLNDEELQVGLNDIEFCLKLIKAGYRNVWTPFAELFHYESSSRGYEDTIEKKERFKDEVLYLLENWKPFINYDPAYNRNLTLEGEDFGLAFPPR